MSKTVPAGYHGFEFWVYDACASILFAQMADVIAETPKSRRPVWLTELKQQLRVHAVLGANQYVPLESEPCATAERKRELLLEATRQARQSPLFFDLTLSPSKSVSIFHASLGENARLAREAGDSAGERYWSSLVAEMNEMIYAAVRAGFAYFQRGAGYTRAGSHNTRVRGRETGRWQEADLAVAHWLQHTSRGGDMQLHVHSRVAHVARTRGDGKWRAPDSLMLIDEASMMSALDPAGLIALAEARNGKVIVAGDTGQLQAVQNGGGMSLLADRLGYVRLAQPVRFRAAWEQAATLRLREGDPSVLADYDQHARVIGGSPEQTPGRRRSRLRHADGRGHGRAADDR